MKAGVYVTKFICNKPLACNMAKGALYWRIKDEKTGKWTYKRAILAKHLGGARWFLNMVEELHEHNCVVISRFPWEEE